MELKMFIRQTQYLAVETSASQGLVAGQPIVYAGTNPATLYPVPGLVQFGNYFEITDDVGNLDQLQITWTTERDNEGVTTPGALLAKRTASNSILIEGDAYAFIKAWLIDHVAAPLNSIDVKIQDTSCGFYEDFIIKASQISWCADDICEFTVTLQQKDPVYQCIQSTLVSDNWQGWFQSQPANGKKHPRFTYCNEVKPNGMMVLLWWITSLLFTFAVMFYIGLLPIIWIIEAIIGVILTIIDAISWLFGGSPNFDDNFNFSDPSHLFDAIGTFYLESSGCGRLHPAPLIRDYIDNVCQKCGVQVDGVTDPIFHSQFINIDLSSDKVMRQRPNPYYNSTYFFAPVKRGIRIFRGLFSLEENLEDYYITDNHPVLSLDMFLDQVKTIFNAEWRLANVAGQPTLYFWRKDWFTLGGALYDFSDGSPDRFKILQGICFNWLDKKQFAYMRGLYAQDATDSSGNEALSYMNDIIGLGDKTNNPVYDGYLDKTSSYFGGTRFRLDGNSDDYISSALQVVLNGSAFVPGLLLAAINSFIVPSVAKFGDYSLLLSDETANLAKIIIWDPDTGFDYARAIRNKSTYEQSVNGSNWPLPTPNQVYNPNADPWYIDHMPNTHVVGSSLSFGSSPKGKYTVQDYFGLDIYARPAELCNYAMFFSSKFTENIFDFFHWIDDTRVKPAVSMQWNCKIDLCCADLQKLKVMNDASDIVLLSKVLLPVPFYKEGKITEITVSYSSEDELGKYIELKGTV